MFKYLLFLLIFREAWSANILMVGLTLSHSHHFWIESIALGLVDKGHNVTFLSLDETKIKKDNYTVITFDGIYEAFPIPDMADDTLPTSFTPWSIPSFIDTFNDDMLEYCKWQLSHSAVQNTLLSYPKTFKYDLIMWDHTMGECLYPIIQHFGNPPTIGLSPFGLTDSVERLYGGHVYPYIGSVCMSFTEASTLWQRFTNVVYINYNSYKRNTYLKPKNVELSRQYFWDWDEDKYDRTEANFNLVLVNWNVVVNQPQALSPNMIPVGGVQIKENKVLSKDVEEIFAIPSSGVIFFSLGSNFQSEFLSEHVLQSFVGCFAELPDYQIIWKIVPPSSLKLPKNVNAIKWAQQSAILAHNKTKLFITHGGGLSTQETTYFGVPIVGMPIFLDQTNNIRKLMMRGVGELVQRGDMQKSNKNIFCEKVKQVLFNDRYAQTMKKLSSKYKDNEMHPMETAIYWVEYVLRHGEAMHLSPLSRNMSVFYTQNLDIYLLFIVFFGVQLYIVWALVRCCWRMCGRSSVKAKTA